MASTSSQAPSSSTTTTKWDVFLSFRGLDTRNTFTSHLYSMLRHYSIQTFMDEPELKCGEVISAALLQAIQESKTYIVVISENYASSSWCLDELVEILTCSKTMKRLVIPVFYNILPSVVRYQIGSFQEHFKIHEARLAGEMERVENWRATLRQVADKSGKHVDGKRSEADIVEEIVDEILPQINPTALEVATYPVGLTSRVQDITALLSSGAKDVIKMGIYGMGGVGKTTLAKALYNHLSPGSFKGRSCFLANVRETSGTSKGLQSLQQQLINDVLKCKNKVEVTSVALGTSLIRARICSTKILVVIDDLVNQEEFNSLVGPFAPGSLVIITTRDEETLDSIDVQPEYRYEVNVLGDDESRMLFFRHALGDTTPDNTQMILSKDILRLAGGLPLALEVFGSYLYKKSEGRWKSYIETLQRNPNSTIQQRLMISLNALELDDPLLKKMFLDIACFFIGREKEEVVEILDTYYSHADDKIDILMKKSLLTINDYNRFRMHDLLQDVGKEIVRNNSPNKPRKHSRLWVPEDICYVLEEQKGTEAIEVVMLHYAEPMYSYKEVSVSMGPLKRMSNLRFLFLSGIILTGKFKLTAENLRWFCWDECPLKCLPIDFYPKELVTLELPGSKMTTLWDVNMVSNAFHKLKTLNMSSSKDLTTTPDFRRLPCLKKLNLEGCTSLKEVHNSIGSLVNLEVLVLTDCGQLLSIAELPPNLRYINAEYCESLERLNLSDSKHLETLYLAYCTSLTEISGLEELTSLVRISLQGCHSSLPARTLTKALFQIYSGFEQEISVCLESENFPDWITQSSVESVQTFSEEPNVELSSTMNLQPNLSHNYSGMILCFEPWDEEILWEVGDEFGYPVHFSVMTSASNILTKEKFHGLSSIVVVPRSIFTVTDADHTINFTSNACRHWIHLLYKNEDDSTSVNVEDERNNPWASDLEVEKGGYPSKRLKLLECDKTGSLEMVEP